MQIHALSVFEEKTHKNLPPSSVFEEIKKNKTPASLICFC